MNLALIPPVLPRAAGIVLGPVSPRLRVLSISACALPISVAASLFTAAYLVSPVLPTTVLVCLSVLWPGADLR